jgi:FkbM family methyltransferase
MHNLFNPCYLFSINNVLRRICFDRNLARHPVQEVILPWATSIEVDLADAIGREIYNYRLFDLAVSECAWRLISPGITIVDAGANIGYMSNLFSFRAGVTGVVHAFEPHPSIRQMLEANIARVAFAKTSARIKIHGCALGETKAEGELLETLHFKFNRGTAKLSFAEASANSPDIVRYPVPVRALDEVFPVEHIDLLKIDVEGHEEAVVKGAEVLLREKRIRHIIYEDHELGHGALPQIFLRHKYEIFSIGYNLFGPTLRPMEQAIALDTSWQSPSYLATLDPAVVDRMKRRGWHVMRGR